ncbi:hypothetical protein BOTBODRAFT_628353 [Botryobasidium botryosum FD-172 SS1]|uniref:DRBM domain-containing protein n=1 Tax=Botryobasidium botryosum (strain FD-172 SS1) TaxID=930990 RepID=A0A067MRV6_BOTB1|nr:hypothetical protein BOTBODRAFT_628353 [Botryobasidium botryosum FD-172 SS1]
MRMDVALRVRRYDKHTPIERDSTNVHITVSLGINLKLYGAIALGLLQVDNDVSTSDDIAITTINGSSHYVYILHGVSSRLMVARPVHGAAREPSVLDGKMLYLKWRGLIPQSHPLQYSYLLLHALAYITAAHIEMDSAEHPDSSLNILEKYAQQFQPRWELKWRVATFDIDYAVACIVNGRAFYGRGKDHDEAKEAAATEALKYFNIKGY